jgi:hypothetical protein
MVWKACAVFSFDGSTKQDQITRINLKLTEEINEEMRMFHYDELHILLNLSSVVFCC